MKPLSEILLLLRSTTAKSFADRHPNQDLVLIEPYEKGREYDQSSPLHAGALVRFMPRAQGKPIPVGRDARAQILLDHPAVSRLHVVLAYTAEGWKAMDRSSNGSFLAGNRMPKEQAVPLPFGVKLRLGRAMVIRMFQPDAFHHYARSQQGGGGGAPPPPAPVGNPTADTWRVPVQAAPPPVQAGSPFAHMQGGPPPARPQPPNPFAGGGGGGLDIDFEFGDPLPGQGAAPTVKIRRPSGGWPTAAPSAPSPPRPPGAPGAPRAPVPPASAPRPPAPPAPPKKRVSDDDIDYEFDFDFDSDGRGGFA